MECQKCKIEMKIVDFKTVLVGVKPYISARKKGTLKGEKISDVLCYVCATCGHIEFLAENPGEFK
ncbi:hypothetical protein [Paraclostridium sordellii]|uniref:Nucleic-acid-binding protein containing Zn-ribbon domain (DUF2082) n=1 Tax=Paraclostridium sordellii TaxID=1505 RepID=A0A0C7EAD1_PARSO|nr:hypothetical protein [Paeniclostridium sordellii]QYE99772.1 hypothetical protein KZ987_18125 [Paeniclostridium sordellii]CEN21953.1 Uncharacterised protein [[Clostridium] sordellii] [Paeniclostridium sordellii]CEP41752.1 Uncharacterised protein [[Clostridium] sordellii] [Paeniclostridium sordellii]